MPTLQAHLHCSTQGSENPTAVFAITSPVTLAAQNSVIPTTVSATVQIQPTLQAPEGVTPFNHLFAASLSHVMHDKEFLLFIHHIYLLVWAMAAHGMYKSKKKEENRIS